MVRNLRGRRWSDGFWRCGHVVSLLHSGRGAHTCSRSPYENWWSSSLPPGESTIDGVRTIRFPVSAADPAPYHLAVRRRLDGMEVEESLQEAFFTRGLNSEALIDMWAHSGDEDRGWTILSIACPHLGQSISREGRCSACVPRRAGIPLEANFETGFECEAVALPDRRGEGARDSCPWKSRRSESRRGAGGGLGVEVPAELGDHLALAEARALLGNASIFQRDTFSTSAGSRRERAA